MTLPDELMTALMQEAEKHTMKSLVDSREGLTHRYKFRAGSGEADEFMRSAEDRLSYILTRMPATYAAVESCLSKWSYEGDLSVLDAGAGPGTASWAALSHGVFGPYTLVERDCGLIELGQKLASSSKLNSAQWVQADLMSLPEVEPHDLVICSYALGEIPENTRKQVLEWLWSKVKKAMLIVEPGSKAGFGVIKTAREHLLQNNAFLVAPCPHHLPCGMPSDDWCHFSVRLERTNIHRYLKKGSLSFEDEKFSYILASKNPIQSNKNSRIVGYPLKHSGHLSLKLCTPEGLVVNKTISRKEGERYKEAKKAEWGDAFKCEG